MDSRARWVATAAMLALHDALSVAELADGFDLDAAAAVQRQTAVLLRNDLLDRADDPSGDCG